MSYYHKLHWQENESVLRNHGFTWMSDQHRLCPPVMLCPFSRLCRWPRYKGNYIKCFLSCLSTLQLHQNHLIFQSEKIWLGQSIKSFEAQEKMLCGDVLLTAAYVCYVGSFTQQYRQELVWDCMWVPFSSREGKLSP